MRIDFVNELARRSAIERRDLLEKDIVLHQTLTDLSKDDFFSTNFLFKGGTCLIKGYIGYLRFSEDIDFTWKNQKRFSGKSQNEVRRMLSGTIDRIGKTFEKISKARGFEFKCRKDDRKYVELGGSNKFCTFKVWYDSAVLGRKSFFKVQFNFTESLCFRPKAGRLKSLPVKDALELSDLFPEYREYSKPVKFQVYDVREILSEKVRAILTRRGTKARDFLDVYLVNREYKIKPASIEKCAVKKVEMTLRMYERYRAHFTEKAKRLESADLFEWGSERDLLISEIDKKEFYSFLREFQRFLEKVAKAISQGTTFN
jgi:predicted nucleotidyltransferase component of viral defense system